MAEFTLRKTMIFLEEIAHDGGPSGPARQRGAIVALVKNPFAGGYVEDIASAMDDLKPLGLEMTDKLIAAMGGIEGIDGYGKAAMCGEAGELEHTALWHVPGGYSMRERLGEALAIVPSSMKQGGPGTRIDIPLGHINAAYVRSHFDAMEVGLPDGPKADELLFALAMSRGGRIHARVGGLTVDQISKGDGLR
ncbi:amino acid synthesis family protein [Pseudooceanicola sediminis]|uniref:Amino acid synthesis family protein n=1 Tax=Pseudooceanicola sediminis TaxID=2211117 RepID=A0A399J2I0_9RHOB|nr:amino acid synthesis family protein [Pseudooceanicola sediminis]KAA2313851.1 amino acid synthesis family protein [Puniceibacterium sp. HSS470]RII38669.1 amino acid synthesis family protein [Pseudooceanicola sediminis]|tara:strand:- start:32545 stop:33123 length:579 start_codon:yes stop_codon:yes gene_type:complete